jgi:hypothetical protein
VFTLVPAEVLDRWGRLAAQVRDALAGAGLPVAPDRDDCLAGATVGYFAGATVDVDPGDDDAGGVFVRWHPHRRLTNAALAAVAEQRFDDPALGHFGAVAEAMRQAIWSILDAAGFALADPHTDYRPLEIQVVAGPPDERG